jgi:hypothetical protein
MTALNISAWMCTRKDQLASMPCKSCGSANQRKFTGELGIHFPGLKNIDKPVAWLFPELVVCLGLWPC